MVTSLSSRHRVWPSFVGVGGGGGGTVSRQSLYEERVCKINIFGKHRLFSRWPPSSNRMRTRVQVVSNPIGDGVGRSYRKPKSFSRRFTNCILQSSPLSKAVVLGLITLAGSVLKVLDVVPKTFLADKHNPLNQYMAKLSWLWTLIFILAAIILTGPLYSALDLKVTIKHFLRVGVGHLVWFVGTSVIDLLHLYSGDCSQTGFATPRVCSKAGHQWLGLEISGHTFLLTYCILVITEEAANVKLELWVRFRETALQDEVQDKLPSWTRPWFQRLFDVTDRVIPVAEIYSLALVILWFIMVAATALYFHLLVDKVLGYLLGVLSWYGTYEVLYQMSWCWFCPCRPNVGSLHPYSLHKLVGAH